MSIAPATDDWHRNMPEEFLALVCNDPDLLRAEFDSIVADSWTDPPEEPPTKPPLDNPAARRPGKGSGRPESARLRRPCVEPSGQGVSSRLSQRSPPRH